MLPRLLRADLTRGRVVAVTLIALIALASTLMAASTSLIVDTITATNRLSERANVPDLIQMHAGQADARAVADWAETRSEITAHETIKTLPVPRQELWIAGANQADSYHEPAFVTAPQRIDLLLDEHGDSVRPARGEVALPIHYRVVGLADVGDEVTVGTGDRKLDLKVTGFVRDAQMNAAMIPSKRLVVSPEDFATLEKRITEPEYLFEFTLADSARPGTVIDEYKAAGLPSTGIHIDSSMLTLMNAVSTLLIAAVALVVALVLMVVSVLALRYTVLAAIEADLAQIAVLKAIGAPQRRIRRLYLLKYVALALAGAVLGYAAGFPLSAALGAPTMLYLGTPPTTVWSVGLPVLAVLALTGAIVGLTSATLRRVGRISAIEALRSGTSASLRKRRNRWRLTRVRRLPVQQWLGAREALRSSNALLLAVLALCTFTMVLPTNVTSTFANPRFATFLGSGESDLRIDVRTGSADLGDVERAIAADSRVGKHTTVLRREYEMRTPTGEWESVLIDVGDHRAFPMQYMSGGPPTTDDEVSLSYNQAEATKAEVGSTVVARTSDGEKQLTVTGVYQDITNNGLTAKATFDDGTPAIWQIIYADLRNPDQIGAVSSDLTRALPGVQVTGMHEYASQFFGATTSQLRIIAALACAIALGLAFLITVLFTVLVLSRERPQIAVLRALGCTRRALAGQYLTRFGILTVVGVVLGFVLVSTLGEAALGVVLGSRGAPSVELLPTWWLVGLVMPVALIGTVVAAVALALRRLTTMTLITAE